LLIALIPQGTVDFNTSEFIVWGNLKELGKWCVFHWWSARLAHCCWQQRCDGDKSPKDANGALEFLSFFISSSVI